MVASYNWFGGLSIPAQYTEIVNFCNDIITEIGEAIEDGETVSPSEKKLFCYAKKILKSAQQEKWAEIDMVTFDAMKKLWSSILNDHKIDVEENQHQEILTAQEAIKRQAIIDNGLEKLSALLQADFDDTNYLCRPMFPSVEHLGNKFFVAKVLLNKKDNKSLICFKDKKFTSIVNDACLVPAIEFTGLKAMKYHGEKRAGIGSKCLMRVIETRKNSFVAKIICICVE